MELFPKRNFEKKQPENLPFEDSWQNLLVLTYRLNICQTRQISIFKKISGLLQRFHQNLSIYWRIETEALFFFWWSLIFKSSRRRMSENFQLSVYVLKSISQQGCANICLKTHQKLRKQWPLTMEWPITQYCWLKTVWDRRILKKSLLSRKY